jgi:hypothetical protein
LSTWRQALDALDADEDARPGPVMRFGAQVDVKGIDGGSPDADRAVRYLTKYLAKAVTETYTDPEGEHIDPAYEAHINRLHTELRYVPTHETKSSIWTSGVDEGCNPRSQGALTGALRTIDTDNAYAIVCRALHDLGNHVVKAQYRHTETIAALASAPAAMRWVLVR